MPHTANSAVLSVKIFNSRTLFGNIRIVLTPPLDFA